MENGNKAMREWLEAIGIALLLALLIKTFVLDTIQVDGNSMVPTLRHHDRLIMNKFEYRMQKPERGEIVVFQYPHDRTYYFIKRVIAVEGDTVEIANGEVIVNGQALKEPYILEKTSGDFSKRLVPKDTIFVLGDNRNNSKDSRFKDVGPVSLKLVKGRAVFRIWPFHSFGKIM